MVTRVDKYLGGLGIDATGKLEVTDNASVVVGNGSTTGNVYAGTINSGGVELRANDYATLLSARSNDGATLNLAYSNDGSTLGLAYSNDGSTLSTALSNDFNTYSVALGGITGANTAILNLQTGLTGTNTNLSGNVAIFTGAFTGSNTRLSGAESNVIALQGGLAGANTVDVDQTTGMSGTNTNLAGNVAIFTGAFTGTNTNLAGNVAIFNGAFTGTNTNLSGNVAIFTGAFTGTNTNLAGNVAIFTGAFTGSNTRLSGAESNVIALQGGLAGANTVDVNQTTGMSGTNTNLSGNVAIFNGAFTGSNTRLSGAESNVIALQGGLSGTNTNITALTSSPVTFQSNVTILGNLTLTGNTTIITANTISFGDSLLSLASNSTADVVDIGLYGHYSGGGYSNNHTGIIRSVASQDWMFFAAYAKEEPNLTVDIANSTFALANIRVRTANASLNVFAANALISPLVYSGTVELRANDYATYLMAKGGIDAANTINTNQTTGLTGANTNITNLTSGLTGANTNISARDTVANVYTTWNYLNSNIVLKSNTANPTFTGTVTIPNLTLSAGGGIEGGQLDFANAVTNTTITTGIAIDIYGDQIRFFEKGANTRGAYINLTAAAPGIGSNLLAGSGVSETSNVVALQGGLAGANTAIALRALADSPTFTGNATFDTTTLFVDSLNDRVGIGTSSPSYKLHVAGTGTAARIMVESTGTSGSNLPTLYFNRTSNVSSASDFQGSLVWSRTLTDSTSITSSIQSLGTNISGSQAMNMTYNAYTSHQFQINASEAMRIDSSSNVGIGTSSPAFKLDVRGTANTGALTSTTVSSGGVELRANDYATYLMALGGLTGANTNITNLTSGLAGANTAIALRALAASPTFTGNATFDTNTLFVDSLNDRVGIGTTTPGYKLQVVNGYIYQSQSDASMARIGLSNSNRAWTISNYGTSYSPNGGFVIADETAAAVRMVIDSNGNMGIGTASPSDALSVARSSGEAVISITNSGTASSWLTLSPGSAGSAYIHNTGNTSTIFTTNGTERMRIDSSGNVGIGTSSTAYKLDVRGSANVGALTTSGTVTLGSNTNVKITGGSANQYLQTDGSGNLSYVTVQGVPVASIIMYGANTAPSGWLTCDGTAVSRSTYAALFAVVSNVFGIGDNTTTFNLPDFRGRSPYGVDASQSIAIGASSAGKINVNFQTATGTGTSGSTADTNTVTTSTTNSTTDKDVTNSITVVTGVTPIAHTHTIPALTVTHPAEVVQFIIKT